MPPHPSASLYTGNLDPSVTETMLFDIFNQVGPVTTVRICRDYVSKRSLGYAYVNYESPSDAERALNTLNYTLVKGKPIRIMWSQRDPSLRKSGVGNVFIKNLDKSIDDKSLHDTFSAFGSILSCKVVHDEHGVSRGYGFVHYENEEDAKKAIERVNGMLLNGIKVYVGLHSSRKDRQARIEELKKSFTNVFLKNLPDSITSEELEKMGKEFGEVASAFVNQSKLATEKNIPTKFGFINFKSHESAVEFIDKKNESDLKGNKIFVARAQKKAERAEEIRRQKLRERQERQLKIHGKNVYVKNLDDSITEDELRGAFQKFGTIQSCRISKDKYTKKSRGFGFVCFETMDEANKAITGMMGTTLRTKPLYCTLAMSKEDRIRMFQQQHFQQQYRGYPPQMNPAAMYAPSPFMYNMPTTMPMARAQQSFMYPTPAPQPMYPKPRWQTQQNNTRSTRQPNVNRGMPRANRNHSSQPMNSHLNKSYQFTPQVRNQPNHQVGVETPPAQPQQLVGVEPLNAQDLAAAPPEQQKQMLGNAIYAQVNQRHKSDIPEFAGKVTGMLLELDNSELLNLIEDPQQLDEKVRQAKNVLQQPEHN